MHVVLVFVAAVFVSSVESLRSRSKESELIVPTIVKRPSPNGYTGAIPPYQPPVSLSPFARNECGQWKCNQLQLKYKSTNLLRDYNEYIECLNACEPELIEFWVRNWIHELLNKDPRRPRKNDRDHEDYVAKFLRGGTSYY
uniref:Uncharacterized protein n=1 Tax=Trichuris muris TaxID=70415 RepID=A0A5S6QRW0_TRIMR